MQWGCSPPRGQWTTKTARSPPLRSCSKPKPRFKCPASAKLRFAAPDEPERYRFTQPNRTASDAGKTASAVNVCICPRNQSQRTRWGYATAEVYGCTPASSDIIRVCCNAGAGWLVTLRESWVVHCSCTQPQTDASSAGQPSRKKQAPARGEGEPRVSIPSASRLLQQRSCCRVHALLLRAALLDLAQRVQLAKIRPMHDWEESALCTWPPLGPGKLPGLEFSHFIPQIDGCGSPPSVQAT